MVATPTMKGGKRRPDGEGRMPLADHLRELRKRFLLAGAGIVVGAIAGWFLYPWFFDAINAPMEALAERGDRKSTRLNSSHVAISYAVFCLKKKNTKKTREPRHT